MASVAERKVNARTGSLSWPAAMLVAALLLAALLLSVPLSLPIGPMYWDSYLYYDGANRIFSGQVPAVDFFAPVGPLGYYLFAGWLTLFPNGQTTLITHWALLAVTIPLMLLVVFDIDRRSRATAWAVVIPFLLFSLLPFNGREFYPFPSSDGFGIYNRQICQMLYVLTAALLFVRHPWTLALVVGLSMTAMFFLKITGFVAGGLICLFALFAGRIAIRQAATAALLFAGILVVAELWSGVVSAYLADINALVAMNSGTLLPRLVQAASINVDIVGSSIALALVLAWADRKAIGAALAACRRQPSFASIAALLDRDALWLTTLVVAGIVFEAQNTGSQALIFLWPILWRILCALPSHLSKPRLAAAIAVLAAAAYLPMVVGVLERAARTYVGALRAVPLESRNLKALGNVTTRDHALRRAEVMLELYPRHQEALGEIAEREELPTPLLFSDLDFQVAHLIAIDRAVDSIRALETGLGKRFDTIMTMSFANPFPYLMDRQSPRMIAIGADPFRAVPAPDEEVLRAISQVDLVLYPKCPDIMSNRLLWKIYEPALRQHRRVELDNCFTAYVAPDFVRTSGS